MHFDKRAYVRGACQLSRNFARSRAVKQFSLVTRVYLVAILTPLGSTRAATFTVTNTHNNGPGSLRQAIFNANANPGADTIAFNIPGAGDG